jgi:hypothetical protein
MQQINFTTGLHAQQFVTYASNQITIRKNTETVFLIWAAKFVHFSRVKIQTTVETQTHVAYG